MSLARARERVDTLPAPPALDARCVAVFADLDGTLAPLQATPYAVGPDAHRRQLLSRLNAALDGRLAMVTGRSLEDIDRVLESGVVPVAAVHGLVRRTASGRIIRSGGATRIPEAKAAFEALARADHGLLVEDKGAAVALHYRRSPQASAACRELATRLEPALGLKVQEGDQVVELREPGPDKGEAIRAFMAEPPFAGAQPVFLGDDLTDEAGFRAVRALGGYPIIVGRRRPTEATFALPDIAAAHAWLDALANHPGR